MLDYAQPNFRGQRLIIDQKCKEIIDRNKDNNSTHFNFSILFAKYKSEKLEIRHVPSCYENNQFPSLASTKLLFFVEVHVKQVSIPPTISRVDDYNILFPSYEEGKMDVERGFYDTNNQLKSKL